MAPLDFWLHDELDQEVLTGISLPIGSATVSESKNSEVDSTIKEFLEYTWLKNQKKLINAYNKI